ncbi:MAG: acetaldehyde dehydrogenase (acetylating) [Myxococcales bacterium]|nr:acetaldehyde dehydrogenase (acetylating) [Myxococcales bacterium]
MTRSLRLPPPVPVALIGSGMIGTDLLVKLTRSPVLKPVLFVGRRPDSPGLLHAEKLGIKTSTGGLEALLADADNYEVVIDATSAPAHVRHWAALKPLGKKVIDMTPSNIGQMTVPAISPDGLAEHGNVNVVTCGGQASIPLAHAICQVMEEVRYIEIVASFSYHAAGPATKAHTDEYIEITQEALSHFTGCAHTKVIGIMNPARPPVDMQVTVSVMGERPDMERVTKAVRVMVAHIKGYVPGYSLVLEPTWDHNRVVVSVRVVGRGDWLPTFAGNLDIINCAAIASAECYARSPRREVAHA